MTTLSGALAIAAVVAQSGQGGSAGAAVFWTLVLGVVIVLGGAGAMMIRRRALGTGEVGTGESLSLETLRRMRASGQLSEEEFNAARRVVLAQSGVVDRSELRAPRGYDLAGDPLPPETGA